MGICSIQTAQMWRGIGNKFMAQGTSAVAKAMAEQVAQGASIKDFNFIKFGEFYVEAAAGEQ